MLYIENFLSDPDARLITAEDNAGLFVLLRYGEEQAQDAMRTINEDRNTIKWCLCFRKETTTRAAADAFFEELRQRNLTLPRSLQYLAKEMP